MAIFEYIRIISLLLILSTGAVLAFLVYRSDMKKIMNKMFFLLVFFSLLWILFSSLGNMLDGYNALVMKRLNYAMLMPFFITAFLFTTVFPKKQKWPKTLSFLMVLVGALSAGISMFTDIIVSSIKANAWSQNIIGGKGFVIFNSMILVITVLIFINLIINYFRADFDERKRILYLIIGASFYAFFNVIFNILIPLLLHTYQFDFIGDYSIIIFVAFTAYAIMKHQLFNIKMIATEIIVLALSLGLFIQAFSASNSAETIVNFIIWAATSYGGWLLIRSVKKEIKQREELEKLTKQLENANEHLKEMDKLKDDFLSMASHELNTPITAIKGYLSMILEEHLAGEVNPTAKQYLSRVYESAKRLSNLVKDLLNVSRIESGRIHIIYEEAQIVDLIEQAQAEVMPNAKNAGHKMTFEKPAKALPKTWMDKTRIMEILINIMGNAIKYTDALGLIESSVSANKDTITVAIKDNGRGIPKDKQESVFNKFSQVDVLKDQVKGTGLGMYISKKFIELMGGKIWFESKEGKGTTFFFTIPILDKKPIDPHEGEGEVLH